MTQTSDFAPNKHLLAYSVIVSEVAVIAFFAAANLIMGKNGLPLGADTYITWQPDIRQVLSVGSLQFAANHHYVEVLYPILASIPVRLGATIDEVEIYAPIVLAVASVAATAYLAREFRDAKIAVLTVAFTAGWFAIYRMGADFRGQLLAFPLLLLATTLLLRVGKTSHLPRDVALFAVLVGLAALAHVETTAMFVLVWAVTFLVLGLRGNFRKRRMLVMLAVAVVLSIAILPAALNIYPLIFSCGANCRPYPVYPPYWLEVFGPEVALAILGLLICAYEMRRPEAEPIVGLVLAWSVVSIIVGILAYVFPWVNLEVSDRTLLMLPVPFLSAVGTGWLGDRSRLFSRYPNLLSILVFLIPAVTAPAVFAYLVPQRFRYYPPSLL
jgi:hypothetical protein